MKIPLRTVVFCLLALASIRLPILGLLALCYVIASRLPIKISFFESFILGFFLTLVLNNFVYECLNFFHIHTSPVPVGIIYVTAGWYIHRTVRNAKRKQLFVKSDLVFIIITLITFGAMLYPVFKNRPITNSYAISSLHLLSNGEDNASHYALYKYAYVNDSYAYGSNSEHTGLITTLVNYPQGSEFNLGWIARATLGDGYTHKDTILVEFYFILTSGMFSILVGLIVLAGIRLYENQVREVQISEASLVISVSAVVLFCGPLLEIVGRGFQSQVAAYIYLVLLLLILVNRRRISSQVVALGLLMLTFAGVCMAWWYLFPVALAPILWFTYKTKLYDIKRIWPLFMIPLLGVYPVILGLLSSSSASSINQPGGIDKISYIAMVFYILSSLIVCFYAYKKRLEDFGYIVSMLATWVVFTALVAIYQLTTIHSLQYYYFKSLYTLLPISGACVIYGCLVGYNHITKNVGQWMIVLPIAPVAVVFIGLACIKPVYPRVYLNDWYNNPINSSQLIPLYTTTETHQHSDLLFIGSCSNSANYLMNRWSGAFMLSDTPQRDSFVLASLKGDTPQMLHYLKYTAKNSPYVQIDDSCLAPQLSPYSKPVK